MRRVEWWHVRGLLMGLSVLWMLDVLPLPGWLMMAAALGANVWAFIAAVRYASTLPVPGREEVA